MRLLKSAMPVFAAFLGGMVGSFILFGVLQSPSHAGVGTSPGLKQRVEAIEEFIPPNPIYPPDPHDVLTFKVDDLISRVRNLENPQG